LARRPHGVQETAVAESSLPSSFNWYEVPFSGHSGLDPNTRLCLALTTYSSNDSMSFQYQGGSVSEPDSGGIDGDPNWKDIKTDKAMLYKVHGTYETASSSSSEPGVYLLEGSWTPVPAP
jgi:hypothetical protein